LRENKKEKKNEIARGLFSLGTYTLLTLLRWDFSCCFKG
jgi:hypothetical protein